MQLRFNLNWRRFSPWSAFGSLAAIMLLPWTASADDDGPVLVVPASQSTLCIVAPHEMGVSGWLLELDGHGPAISAQIVSEILADGNFGCAARCAAIVPPRDGVQGPRRFRSDWTKSAPAVPKTFQWMPVGDKSLKLCEGDRPVLVYNFGTITDEKVPKTDSRRSRACYVHPLWGLNGEVLTDDFPKDHYHHHGVFWTWPHVGIGGKQYDLWAKGDISQRFVGWLDRSEGPVAAVLGVENGWFVGDKKVMIERVWLRCFKAAENDRALDLDLFWIPVDQPITLRGAEEKSYGGLTMRFAVGNERDSLITVPQGPAKQDLPDTPLAWADLSARFKGAASTSGAAIFVPRDHPDYPPTWLTRHYGPLCVGWPGVKGRTFEPGKPIHLSYRIWIHRSTVGVEQLRQAYDAYTAAAGVQWQ